MKLEDNDIRRILASSEDKEVTPPPAWENISGGVKKQNFFKFGMLHVNIYLIGIVTALAGVVDSTFVNVVFPPIINRDQVEYVDPKPKLSKEDLVVYDTVFIDTEQDFVIEDSTLKPSKSENFIQKVKEKITSKETNYSQSESGLQVDSKIENNSKTDSVAVIDTTPKKDETKIVEVKQKKPESKKIIVFETDTVIEFDTLTVNKKTRKRL